MRITKFIVALKVLMLLSFMYNCSAQSDDKKESKASTQDVTFNKDSLTLKNKPYHIEASTEDGFKKAKDGYKNILSKESSSSVIIKNNAIDLVLANNKKITFTNIKEGSDETETKEYKYVGQSSQPDYFVINAKYWEGSEFFLVNKQNGRIDTLWNSPLFSPELKYIACQSEMYGMDGVPNGIQIFSVRNSSLEKIVAIDQQEWVPLEVVWENEKSLIIKANNPEDYLKKVDHFIYLKVIIL